MEREAKRGVLETVCPLGMIECPEAILGCVITYLGHLETTKDLCVCLLDGNEETTP